MTPTVRPREGLTYVLLSEDPLVIARCALLVGMSVWCRLSDEEVKEVEAALPEMTEDVPAFMKSQPRHVGILGYCLSFADTWLHHPDFLGVRDTQALIDICRLYSIPEIEVDQRAFVPSDAPGGDGGQSLLVGWELEPWAYEFASPSEKRPKRQERREISAAWPNGGIRITEVWTRVSGCVIGILGKTTPAPVLLFEDRTGEEIPLRVDHRDLVEKLDGVSVGDHVEITLTNKLPDLAGQPSGTRQYEYEVLVNDVQQSAVRT
jgi:hypothetical protein